MAGVVTKHESYLALQDRWERCRDCVSGSDAVKAKGTKYLPALDSHATKPNKYEEYKTRALYYNAVGRTVAGLSGGIFQKAPAITVDSMAKEHIKDITLTGEPIDMFALEATKEYLTTGRYGILIDMSGELAVSPRPYWVGYESERIINWRFEKMGGDQELCLVVLQEFVDKIDPNDEFSITPQEQYRVLRLEDGIYTQEIYIPVKAENGSSEKKFQGQGRITPLRLKEPLNFIPFSLPWGISTPPLIDLVDVNLSHYRGSADLKHGLHFTALPTPWISGQVGSSDKALAIGSGTAWVLDTNGKAGMLEFTGHGLGAIRTDLLDMQKHMATLGARLLEEAPHYAETALSVSLRHSSDYATLRTIAQVIEQQLSWALKVHTWWLGSKPLVSDIKDQIELNKTFFDQQVTADELRALLLALQAGTISYKTFYSRLSATGWMREGIDSEEELNDIKSDGDQFEPIKPGVGGLPSEKLGSKPGEKTPPPDPKSKTPPKPA